MSKFQLLSFSTLPVFLMAVAPVQAQSPACAEGAKLLQQRGAMIQALAGSGKAKPTAAQACSRFGALVGNGQKLIAWFDQNGAWCNVPEQVVVKVKDDHQQSVRIRGQACNVAAQQKKLEARARAQAQQGGYNPFAGNGGDVVSGQLRVPQGAL